MKKLNSMVLLAALSVGTATYGQNSIIPKPQKITVQQSVYNFNNISIQSSKAIPEAVYLQKQLKSITGQDYKLSPKANVTFTLLKKDAQQKDGYYTLTINEKGINISGYDNQGLFYGVQTLLQLVEEHKTDLKIPYLEIEDYPKFAYRGMMLDVSRHFFNAEEVKNYLDYLAAYKYNKFHWHLTDDQGWRIEIKKYPKLTEVGAWRDGSQVGRYIDMKFDDKRYGGFYTQEQIKDVVAYAKKLHIDVIPEIEMPDMHWQLLHLILIWDVQTDLLKLVKPQG